MSALSLRKQPLDQCWPSSAYRSPPAGHLVARAFRFLVSRWRDRHARC